MASEKDLGDMPDHTDGRPPGIASELRRETRDLLRALQGSDAALQRLNLSLAPLGIRDELQAHGLAAADARGDGALVLTPLGRTIMTMLPPLSVHETRALAE